MKRPLLISILIIITITISCQNSSKKQSSDAGEYSISTESQTNNRVKKLGMDNTSEDSSYILDRNKLITPIVKNDEPTNKTNAIPEFDQEAFIMLKSDSVFDGMQTWNVLQSVGLNWGDGDLFHWVNTNQNFGDDALFSVGTTTNPGYFLPESVKTGQMNPADLLFAFSIPRNFDPKNVFNAMINAVKYCQKHLGGKMRDKHNHPFNEEKEKQDLELLLKKMNSQGLIPGSNKALITY